MNAQQPLATVALVALLLTAGCVAVPTDVGGGGGSTSLAPESPASDDWSTTVHERAPPVGYSDRIAVDGELPVNATRTYRRVERLLGADAPAPRVEIRQSGRSRLDPPPSMDALGFSSAIGDFGECAPIGSGSASQDTVYLSKSDPSTGEQLSDGAIELVLAHEYAHVLQQANAARRGEDSDEARAEEDEAEENEAETTRNRIVNHAMREGFAVAVAESYAREYDVRWAGQRPMELRWCLYRQSRNTLGVVSASYYFGGRYYLSELDGTGELLGGVESPPNTTEQLLHPETRGDEPPVPLAVDAADSRRWETTDQFSLLGSPAGEATIRVWLRSALDRDRLDAAATGWGNGTTVTYAAGELTERRHGAVWVLRWDTESDADEFEDAARAAESTIETEGNTSLSIQRVSDRTVVVAGGPASFVEGLAASGSGGSVTLTPPKGAEESTDG